MVLELVKVHVAYSVEFAQQIAALDRGLKGPRHARTLWNACESPNIAYGAFEWESVEQARAYWQSDAGREEVTSWRSVTEPQFERLQPV